MDSRERWLAEQDARVGAGIEAALAPVRALWADFTAGDPAALPNYVERSWNDGLRSWDGRLTSSIGMLRLYWVPPEGEPSGRAFYDAEVRDHWADLTQEQRAHELEKLIRMQNLLSEYKSDGYASNRAPDQTELTWHLVSTKVELLAYAFDHTYDGDYIFALTRDPMQFGLPEPAE